jgi:predicted dehydrogenase
LATQDLAVVLHLLDDQPIEVAAHGEAYLQQGVPDVVFCYVKFATGISAHLHVSWLDPNKLRRLTVIGSKEMAVFDDTQPVGKLSLYERTRDDLSHRRSSGAPNIGIGTIVSPRLPCDAPLRLECEDFIAAARAPARSAHGARLAAAVVHVLAGLQQSLDLGGAPVPLGTGFEPAASVAAHPVTRLIQGGRGA